MLMKHCKSALVLTGALSTVLLAGCKDDSLDLSDIDTTLKVEVNDLVLPINLKPIVFDDMVDLKDTEGIEKINGEYVLLKSGKFNSEEINIKEISTDAKLHFDPVNPVEIPSIPGYSVDLVAVDFPFSYSYEGVDKYIMDIYSGKVDVNLTFTISAKDGDQGIKAKFENMQFILPEGFYGEVYGSFATTPEQVIKIDETSSNIVNVPDATTDANGDYKFIFHITSFVFDKTGATFENSNFHIDANFGLLGGKVTVEEGNGNTGSLDMSFDVSKLEVKTFSGKIYYDLDNLDPEAISLNDLPDVLTDPGTHLGLKNPQLYIKLTNPLGKEGLKASTGLEITQQRPEGEEIITSYLKNGKVTIAAKEGEQSFCLSPIDPKENMYSEFPGAQWNEMVNLGNIVNGDGLPQGLNVQFKDPQIDESEVNDFSLSQDLGTIHGEYTFFAPLELSEGSSIYYQEETTGWDLGGDDNEINVKQVSLTADCTSDLPVGVKVSATPLNSEGKAIDPKDFTVEDIDVPAFADKAPIAIKMTGNIKDLDGMRFTITVATGTDTGALKPTMSLKLDNVKVMVSASYIIDLNDK